MSAPSGTISFGSYWLLRLGRWYLELMSGSIHGKASIVPQLLLGLLRSETNRNLGNAGLEWAVSWFKYDNIRSWSCRRVSGSKLNLQMITTVKAREANCIILRPLRSLMPKWGQLLLLKSLSHVLCWQLHMYSAINRNNAFSHVAVFPTSGRMLLGLTAVTRPDQGFPGNLKALGVRPSTSEFFQVLS